MEIPVDKPCFVDTNILLYATNALSPLYQTASSYLNEAHQAGRELVISRQVLREYLAIATRPESDGKCLIPLEIILHNLRTFQRELTLLEDTPDVFTELLSLVEHYPVGGKQIHDANIVATMLAHGVTHLLTHNVSDFARFAERITVLPLVRRTEAGRGAAEEDSGT